MIFSQSYIELGSPAKYVAKGLFTFTTEYRDAKGYGVDDNVGTTMLLEDAQKQIGDDSLIGVKIERMAGSSHPNYYVTKYRITGDRYGEEKGPTTAQVVLARGEREFGLAEAAYQPRTGRGPSDPATWTPQLGDPRNIEDELVKRQYTRNLEHDDRFD